MSKKTIIAHVDQVLKPAGFVRRKARWNRRVGDFVDAVDLQVSKAGDSITVNAGVLDPVVHTMLWATAPSPFIDEPHCTVRSRIGDVIDESDRDKWWPIDDDDSAGEIAHLLAERVIPFLDHHHSRGAMEQWLTDPKRARRQFPMETLGLIILKSLLGKAEEACTMLLDCQKKSASAWGKKCGEVAVRLGCKVG